MRIVSQSVLFAYSQPPDIPLLSAPCVAGLLPATISTPQMTVLKKTDHEYMLSMWREYRPKREFPDTRAMIREKIIQAQERLEARFAQIDAEIAARRRYKIGGEQ